MRSVDLSALRHRTDRRIRRRQQRTRRAVIIGALGLAAGAAMATGVVIEYLLDPDRGRARRVRLRDRAARETHRSRDHIGGWSRHLANRSRGVAANTRYHLAGRHTDDVVLRERARETLGRKVSHPHAVEVEVHSGVVTLHGDVLADEDRRACRALQRVPGVDHVEAHWTVHTDPAGVPTLRGGH